MVDKAREKHEKILEYMNNKLSKIND